MAGLSFTGLVAAFASAVNAILCGTDDKPRPSTNAAPRPPYQVSPLSYTRGGSYARDQAAGQVPVTSDYGRSFDDSKHTSPHAGASARTQASYQPPSAPSRSQTTVRPTATAAHDRRAYGSGLTPSPAVQSRQPAPTSAPAFDVNSRDKKLPTLPSYTRNSYTRSQSQTAGQTTATPDYNHSSYPPRPVAGESRPTPQTSVRAQNSYQPPSTYGRVSQHTVRTSATTDNERNLYRSDSCHTSPDAGQPHQTLPASPRTRTSYQPPSTPSCSHATVRNLATIDYDRSLSGPSRSPPPAGESRQTTSTSAHARASYQRSPSPVPYSSPAYLQVAADVSRSGLTHVIRPSPVLSDLSDPESDEMEYIEDDDTAKKLRDRARRQHREMCEARARAKSAHRDGDYVAESKHKKEAVARKDAMEMLNAQAAKIIFHQKNKGHKQGTVDLHGLHVQEAIQYAKQELQSASWRDGGGVIRFIVGKGLHAKDGRAKIRPALEKLFTERDLIHSLDPRNAGVLIVQLD
ncbi:hypothetical protein BJV78DRAFT_1358109 [Lactifluus subvellereus]|nr:hypothetical protein BJV78DRAFT_1358109 [Lactifluus subvellereus]